MRCVLGALVQFVAISCFAQAPDISYTPNSVTYTVNTSIVPLIPTNIGGAATTTAASLITPYRDLISPQAIATDAANNVLYVADVNVVRKIDLATGAVIIVAGIPHLSGVNNGPGPQATFGTMKGIARDATSGNIYVTDSYYNNVRKIAPDGMVTILAGPSFSYLSGGNIDAIGVDARFNGPKGITVDKNGNLYIADENNNSIRKITPAGGVTTVLSNLNGPAGVALDENGNIFVAEGSNGGDIKKITPAGVISTLATAIGSPEDITIDPAGNVYAINVRLGKITIVTTDGTVTTIAATGIIGPGIAADPLGNVYVISSNGIEKIAKAAYVIDKPLPAGLQFDNSTGTISGTPTVSLPATVYTITAYNSTGSSSTTVTIKVNDVQPPPVTAPPNITYATPQTYKINNPISPLAPTNTGGAVPPTPYGQVTTVAGGFNTSPSAVPDIANGVIYVCDWGNNLIKKVVLATGAVSVFAGTGAVGANNGPASSATFNQPDAIVRDAVGNLYVSDQTNNLIRKIAPDGTVSTLAGNVSGGTADGSGTAASFNTPRGLNLDAAGNLYVADQANNIIRKITPAGVVTTVARGFNTPTGVCLDASGNMYVSDSGTGTIKKISPAGVMSTFAVNMGYPRELRIDAVGNLYVADQYGNTIKKVSPTGAVTTLSTAVNGPIGLALDGLGNIYVADAGSNSVKKISLGGYTIDKPLPAGLTFDAATGIISGTPTVLSPATNYTITAYNISGSSTTIVNLAVTDGLLPSVITFPSLSQWKLTGNLVDPSATSTNTQTPIIYTSSNPTVATIGPDGRLVIHAPGYTLVTANQAGNTIYSPAVATSATLTVMISQTLDFPVIDAKTPCSTDFALNVISEDPGYGLPMSGIPITYTSSNTAVATVSSTGMVHILSAGTTQITANQAGNANFFAAPAVSQTLTVTTPTAPIVAVAASTTNVCEGTPVTFTANVSNLAQLINPSYQWQLNGNNVGSNNSQWVSSVNNGDVVKCIVTNNSSCPATGSNATPPIAVAPYIRLAINIKPTPAGLVCRGTSVKFLAANTNSINSFNYQWQVNGVNVGTNDSTYVNNNFNDGDKITCIVSDAVSRYCLVPYTAPAVTMNVLPLTNTNASVTIQASGDNVYEGTTIVFTAKTSNTAGTLSYQWQVNGKSVGSNNPVFSTEALHNRDTVTCIVNSSAQCSVPFTSPAIIETILPPLVIVPPNTFTPNGDGINDQWLISGLDTYPNCTVAIYSRYGIRLYFSKGYAIPWNGTDNGKDLPAGTYYYVIDLDHHRLKVAGFVAVVR